MEATRTQKQGYRVPPPTPQMVARQNRIKANNEINVLHPYRDQQFGGWFYDDPDLGVFREAFVMGSSEVIDHLVGKETNHFTCFISQNPIPGAQAHLVKTTAPKFETPYVYDAEAEEESFTKGWYQLAGTEMKHWLCGCVLDYFQDYPDHIYVRIENPATKS